MISYRDEILKIWDENSDVEFLKYSPLTKVPDSTKSECLVLGINPSNSHKSLKRVIKIHSKDLEFKGILKELENQDTYNNFLLYTNFKKNELKIIDLQKFCHESHNHFIKQRKFLENINITEFEFFDLFPIWEVEQKKLENNLKSNTKIRDLVLQTFLGFIEVNNTQKLIFLNKGSFQIFLSFFKNIITLNTSTRINIGKKKQKVLESGLLNIEERKIKFYVIGIGGRDNNEKLVNEIKNISFIK